MVFMAGKFFTLPEYIPHINLSARQRRHLPAPRTPHPASRFLFSWRFPIFMRRTIPKSAIPNPQSVLSILSPHHPDSPDHPEMNPDIPETKVYFYYGFFLHIVFPHKKSPALRGVSFYFQRFIS